jgi:hypothetical protein
MKEIIILRTSKQKYYFDSTIGKIQSWFSSSKRIKCVSACNRFREHISFFDHLYIIDQLFIFCLCMPEIIYTRLYTILAIIFYHQISIIGFLSRKINPEFKWWGITRKSLASLFKQMTTMCSVQYIQGQMWN